MYSAGYYKDFWYWHKKDNKPFCVMFAKWTDELLSWSISFFDTIEEVKEETQLLEELYKSISRPYKEVIPEESSYISKKYRIVFDKENQYYWGYIIIDFKNEKIQYFRDGVYIPTTSLKKKYWLLNQCYLFNKKEDQLIIKDKLLRTEKESNINDYKFNAGEYDGWLQFRWGNGKNAIGVYKPEKENKTKKHSNYKPKDKYFKKYDEDIELTEAEKIQEDMDKDFDKENSKYLMNKYGW